MHEGEYRVNGGIGFAINNPSIKIISEANVSIIVEDRRNLKFANSELNRVIGILTSIRNDFKLTYGLKIMIEESEVLTHYGLGTTTMIRLASIESLFIINNHRVSNNELVLLSKRGGTSGIGVRTYFDGGLIFDLGNRILQKKITLEPSSEKEKVIEKAPLLLCRLNMPAWKFGLCIPYFIPNKNEKEEKEFFKETCPISNTEVFETLYHSVYGILSSVLETDLECFETALERIQQCRWKKEERGLYGKDLTNLISSIEIAGANSIAMSSLGPGLVFFSQNLKNTIRQLKKNVPNASFHIVSPRNQGRSVNYV